MSKVERVTREEKGERCSTRPSDEAAIAPNVA